jgi:type IV pilus assembly protein PilB
MSDFKFKNSNSLLDLLVSFGSFTEDNYKQIQYKVADSGNDAVQTAIDLNFTNEDDIANIISTAYGLKKVDLKNYNSADNIDYIKRNIPFQDNFVQQNHIIPFDITDDLIKVAIYDPTSLNSIKELKLLSKNKIDVYVAPVSDLKKYIETIFDNTPIKKVRNQVSKDDSIVIQMVDKILEQAVKLNSSDIHFEPYKDSARLRYRIDGMLENQKLENFNKYYPALTTRVKILANLNIAEKRLPQDGHIELDIHNKNYEFRVSVLPTNFGERVVMRILDKGSIRIPLEKLGFDDREFKILEKSITASKGMILVTGATGSGKTTTLYAALNKINSEDINILTAEDPIEYSLEGVGQVQINEKIGVTFADTLRSFLRQDPDKILVGEIRDKETVDIAIKAALTGHLVLSTLHTNDAISTIDRLIDMGVQRFLITSSLLIIVSQKLARRICPKCKVKDDLSTQALQEIGITDDSVNIYKGEGCEYCGYKGTHGRVGIYELLEITTKLKDLIINGATSEELAECAKQDGFKTLNDFGKKLLLDGVISLDEYHRVLR